MPSNYPDALDSFTNPTASDPRTNPSHAGQHSDINDAMEAVQATLGTNPEGAYASVKARLDVATFMRGTADPINDGVAADVGTFYIRLIG